MKKQKMRGRPKKTIKQKRNMTSLVKRFKKEPTNYVFWKRILKDNKVQEFIDRGSTEQKTLIKEVLKFLKVDDCEFFDEIDGQNLLKQLKGS